MPFRVTRRKLQLPEYATAHMLRHCYATFYLRNLLTKIKQGGLDIPNIFDFCRDALQKKIGACFAANNGYLYSSRHGAG